mgnify:CR=1 FL=1
MLGKKFTDPIQGEQGIDRLHKEPFVFEQRTYAVGDRVTVSTKSGSTYSRWHYAGVTKREDGSILEIRLYRKRFGSVETTDILIDSIKSIASL